MCKHCLLQHNRFVCVNPEDSVSSMYSLVSLRQNVGFYSPLCTDYSPGTHRIGETSIIIWSFIQCSFTLVIYILYLSYLREYLQSILYFTLVIHSILYLTMNVLIWFGCPKRCTSFFWGSGSYPTAATTPGETLQGQSAVTQANSKGHFENKQFNMCNYAITWRLTKILFLLLKHQCGTNNKEQQLLNVGGRKGTSLSKDMVSEQK